MLVNLKEILAIADARGIAVGSFNTPNLESLSAVISAAEALDTPVIIMHAQIHEEMGLCQMDKIAPVMRLFAERATVPVCVHLDHGTDMDYVKRGMALGFTSVMYDGSGESLESNQAHTAEIVALAHPLGISVEAEVGSMGAREGGEGDGASVYTDPDLAVAFCAATGIDALACAFGTAHGVYLKAPKLDIDRVATIHSMLDTPIVMHGGSGVSTEDYRRVIRAGVRKINYYTYMAKAGGDAVANLADKTYFHDIAVAAEAAMRADVERAIRIFANM